jgi:hypothetical protein
MAVMMPRERWTDERLDEAFGRIDSDIRELRAEMKQGFERIDKRFERVDDKFDAMQRNMTYWFIAVFASIVASPLVMAFAASIT